MEKKSFRRAYSLSLGQILSLPFSTKLAGHLSCFKTGREHKFYCKDWKKGFLIQFFSVPEQWKQTNIFLWFFSLSWNIFESVCQTWLSIFLAENFQSKKFLKNCLSRQVLESLQTDHLCTLTLIFTCGGFFEHYPRLRLNLGTKSRFPILELWSSCLAPRLRISKLNFGPLSRISHV